MGKDPWNKKFPRWDNFFWATFWSQISSSLFVWPNRNWNWIFVPFFQKQKKDYSILLIQLQQFLLKDFLQAPTTIFIHQSTKGIKRTFDDGRRFFLNGRTPVSLRFIFVLFKHKRHRKNCNRLQQYSNSDLQSLRTSNNWLNIAWVWSNFIWMEMNA